MIYVDRRQGSGDLAKLWPDAQLGDLKFGDVAILGRGPDGVGTTCGIEIKGLQEIVGDIYAGRFLGYQAPGLRRTYDYCWLVVEGEYKRGKKGELLIPHRSGATGKFSWSQMNVTGTPVAYDTMLFLLITIAQKAGIFLWMTQTRSQTRVFCQALAAWWMNSWESHTSLDTFYSPPSGLVPKEHTLLRLWLKELQGIGWKRSAAAEESFSSPMDMATADRDRFEAIKGISRDGADRIVRAIRGKP